MGTGKGAWYDSNRNMITLHHCVSARSFRPLWMLEEIGLSYQLEMLPFPPRVLSRPYLEVNPLGTVPMLSDGAMRMTESAAICQYLAARFSAGQLDVGPGEPDFGPYLNYLHFGEATLTFPQTLVLRYAHFEQGERKQPQVADDYAKWFLARLRTLEPLLAERDYLCAGRFTAADVSVGYALLLAEHLGLMSGAGVEETPCAFAALACAAIAALKPGRACNRPQ
jgi:glutathione S-transferase